MSQNVRKSSLKIINKQAVGEGSNVVNPRKMYVHYEDQSEIECEAQVRNESMEKIIPSYIPGQRNCLETESTGAGK